VLVGLVVGLVVVLVGLVVVLVVGLVVGLVEVGGLVHSQDNPVLLALKQLKVK
jgi:hypothetical protein